MSASLCVISGMNSAFGSIAGSARVDAFDPVLRHQHDLGVELRGAQRRGRVGREERVAGAGGEDHDPALLQVAHRAAADVGLGDLGDRDRRLHPRRDALLLERVLERQRVEHGREHPHVVAGRPVHPPRRRRQPAVDVAAADDDRHLDPAAVDRRDLLRDRLHALGVGAVLAARPSAPRPRASAARAGRRGAGRAPCAAASHRPRTARTGGSRRSRRSRLTSAARSSSIVLPPYLSSLTCFWRSSTTSSSHLSSLPDDDLARGRSRAGRRPARSRSAPRARDPRRGRRPRDRERRRGGDVQREVPRELDELLVAGDEVRLAVDLDQHADPVARRGCSSAPRPPGPRRRRAWRPAPGPSPAGSRPRVEVALGLDQRVPAIVDPGARSAPGAP